MNQISVVIPTYNEEKIIRENLNKIANYLNEHFSQYEILVVDDGSTDKTLSEVSKVKSTFIRVIDYKPNRGKGYAVKKGVLASKYDAVLFMDADLATPIEEIENLGPYLKDFDVVIASRALPKSKIEHSQPFFRRTFGTWGKKIIRFCLIRGIKDTQCGFKLFRKNAARDLFSRQKIDRWGFDFEILFLAQKKKYTIKEVPIVWYAMQDSKLKFSAYLTTLWELIKVRFLYLLRRY